MKTTSEMQLVPITKLVPYVNNARTHSPEQINKLRSSLEFGLSIRHHRPVTLALSPVTVVFLRRRRKASRKCRVSFADHLTEARRRKHISSPITEWRWMQDGTRSFCAWRLKLCRRRRSTWVSRALTRKNCPTCSRMTPMYKMMILMWTPNCKAHLLKSGDVDARTASGWSAVIPRKRNLRDAHAGTRKRTSW